MCVIASVYVFMFRESGHFYVETWVNTLVRMQMCMYTHVIAAVHEVGPRTLAYK